MQVKEHYTAKPMAANSSLKVGVSIAGFLCTTSGTLSVVDADGTTLVASMAVTAGQFTRIPLLFNTTAGGTVTTAGGGAGTLFS